MSLTGMNFAIFIVAAMLVFAAFYSFMFLVRIFRDVVGIRLFDAVLLSSLCFSFAYVMLSAIVPDHFILSMFMLLMVLAMAGLKIKHKRHFTILETILLFIFTAGISLNNGVKVFMAALITNWRRFFRPKYLLLAVILPSALIWLFARWEYRAFVWPEEMARKEAKAKRNKQLTEKIYRDYADTARVKDSASVRAGVKKIVQQRAQAKYKRDHQKPWNKNAGKPIAQGEFMRWTDISTPRLASTVENLFGESIQLHQDHLLQDVLKDNRPVIVHYRWVANYVVEGKRCCPSSPRSRGVKTDPRPARRPDALPYGRGLYRRDGQPHLPQKGKRGRAPQSAALRPYGRDRLSCDFYRGERYDPRGADGRRFLSRRGLYAGDI